MSVAPLPLRIVLCEGIHDLSFWGGALRRLGAKKGARSPYSAESRGHSSRTGAFIELRQQGRKPSWRDLKQELVGAATRATSEIVLCVDLDLHEDQPDFGQARRARKQDLLRVGSDVKLTDGKSPDACWDPGTLSAVFPLLDQPCATRLSVALWGAACAPGAGIPRQQSLERLVCAAFVAGYPKTAVSVEHWLRSRETPPALSDKEHKAVAASFMAGWFADRDYQGFFQAVWEDEQIATQLETLLQATGTWDVMARVAA